MLEPAVFYGRSGESTSTRSFHQNPATNRDYEHYAVTHFERGCGRAGTLAPTPSEVRIVSSNEVQRTNFCVGVCT